MFTVNQIKVGCKASEISFRKVMDPFGIVPMPGRSIIWCGISCSNMLSGFAMTMAYLKMTRCSGITLSQTY